MATALVKASGKDVVDLARMWAEGRGMRVLRPGVPEKGTRSPSGSRVGGLRASCLEVTVEWSAEDTPSGAQVKSDLRAAWQAGLVVVAVLSLSVWSMASAVLGDGGGGVLGALKRILGGGLLFCIAVAMGSRIRARVRRLEAGFWDAVRECYAVDFLTRVRPGMGALPELLLALGAVCLYACFGAALAGATGAALCAALFIPGLLVVVLHVLIGSEPRWHWRLWILENVTKWGQAVMAVLFVGITLLFMESATASMGTPEAGSHSPWWKRTRPVSPARWDVLEDDARERMRAPADRAIRHPENLKKEDLARLRRVIPGVVSGLLLATLVLGTLALQKVFLGSLVRGAKSWREDVQNRDWSRGPFVPPMAGAWKWRSKGMVAAFSLHYAFGAVANLAACAFAADGVAYMLSGRAALFAWSAHLWSWVFAWSELALGPSLGVKVAAVEVLLVASPFLVCGYKVVRGSLASLIGAGRVAIGRVARLVRKPTWSLQASSAVDLICGRTGFRRPAVLFTRSRRPVARARWLPLVGTALEVSRGMVDALKADELEAVLAHELGHARNDIRLLIILKALSALALFPNHILTLCLDWSRREMDADRFALGATRNPEALRRALLKLSTAELLAPAKPTTGRRLMEALGRWPLVGRLIRWIEEIQAAGRFFLGDGILGYTHPFLSERLAAAAGFMAADANGKPGGA